MYDHTNMSRRVMSKKIDLIIIIIIIIACVYYKKEIFFIQRTFISFLWVLKHGWTKDPRRV